MRKFAAYVLAALFALTTLAQADAQGIRRAPYPGFKSGLQFLGGSASVVGLVASRLSTADGTVGNDHVMSRTWFQWTDDVQTSIKIGLFNGYIVSSDPNANETGNGQITAFQFAIEQANGAVTLATWSNFPCTGTHAGDVTWGCAPAIPVTPGGTTTINGSIESDTLTLPTKSLTGDSAWAREYEEGGAGLFTLGTQDTAHGDRFAGATGSAPTVGNIVTSSGAFTSTSTTNMVPVFYIVAPTSKPTAIILDDSIAWGNGDTDTIDLRKGEIQRSIPQTIASLNLATPTAQGCNLVASTPGRSRAFPYAGNIIRQAGVNDLIKKNSITSAALITCLNNQQSLFRAGAMFFATTITPVSSSTDHFITVGNQSASIGSGEGGPGSRVNYNTKCRALTGFTNFTACFDVAAVLESSLNSGVFTVSNVTSATNLAWTTGTRIVTSPTAQWTSADVGKQMLVVGGTAGPADYVGTIGSFQSTTQVTMSSANPNFGTTNNTNTGAGSWGMTPQTDGVHLATNVYQIVIPASGAIDYTKFK